MASRAHHGLGAGEGAPHGRALPQSCALLATSSETLGRPPGTRNTASTHNAQPPPSRHVLLSSVAQMPGLEDNSHLHIYFSFLASALFLSVLDASCLFR